MRPRLTFANVVSTLIVALALAGGAAYAAKQLPKKSVGAKQLKANAVITAKIKKNAVTAAKIRAGAVDGSKIRDGSVTGADVDASSMPFSQVVARIRNTAATALGPTSIHPVGSYTQGAGEDATYLAAIDVTFGAGCEAPRAVSAYLIEDPAAASEPLPSDVVGVAETEDNGTGNVSRRAEFAALSSVGPGAMADLAPPAATPHTFEIFVDEAECKSGSGITLDGVSIDAIGTR